MAEGVSNANKNESNKQKGGFHAMLIGKSGANSIANMLAGKTKILVQEVVRTGERTIRADKDF